MKTAKAQGPKTKSANRIHAATRASVARDIMTADPMVIDADASVGDAIEILATLEIRHLPVMRGKRLVGILSDRDLRELDGGADKASRTVASVMNTNVISVEPDASLVEVCETLIDQRVGAVPVVESHDDELVGIVSYIDVLKDLIGGAE